MKRLLPILVGLAVLAGCLYWARGYVEDSLEQNLRTEVTAITFRATSLTAGQLIATVGVHNDTRLAGSFEELTGTLRIADRPVDWTMAGLQPGDRVLGGESRELTVTVDLNAADAIGTAAAGLLTGKVEVSFEGELVLSALSMEARVPVSDRRTLSLWAR